jgi:hypothetical protein
MNISMDYYHQRRSTLLALLSITMSVPILLDGSLASWLPRWVGTTIALVALLGVLLVYWRSGALRARLLFGLGAALCVAGATGWLLAHA